MLSIRRKGIRIRRFYRKSLLMYVLLIAIPLFIFFGLLVYFIVGTEKMMLFGIALGVSLIVNGLLIFWLFYKPLSNSFNKMRQKQKIARMIESNKFYETKRVTKNGTNGKSVSKDKISYYPKVYYKVSGEYLFVRFPMDMSKFQDKYLDLGKTFENGLFCDLIEKELEDGFIKYKLLYDASINRIEINDVIAKNGKIKLMKHIEWEYDSVPHMLIAGGTGGGKSYFILALIYAFLKVDADIWVIDPKNADLADLETIMPGRVFYKKGGIIGLLRNLVKDMMERWENVKKREDYVTGNNYAVFGLSPVFLIFDEYAAFMDTLDYKESAEAMSLVKQIVLLGRQAGYFLILAAQRPDAKYLADGIRDQFGFRASLGKMSETGYTMMFGDTDKAFVYKKIRGRGYADTGAMQISEFYSPLVPKNFEFLIEMEKVIQKNNAKKLDEV
ncbi:FtsK/SpoIIIE domain-containing protein [Listeria monocytogenes]|nr:ATP-binding protein [Listeria monocytogenes]